jgi:LysM repeat protein
VRKWTLSACLVLASCALPLTAAAGSHEPGPAQATVSTAVSTSNVSSTSNARSTSNATSISTTTSSSAGAGAAGGTRAVLASESAAVDNAQAGPASAGAAATWTVRPGDTLSGIAAALGVPGGWPALYAANRQAVGPDPDVIRAGTVLALPGASVGGRVRYTVAAGDTLSGIAAALGVPGGWPALYAANQRPVGPDPDVIRAGTVLAVPRPAAPVAGQRAPQPAAPARTRHQAAPPAHAPAPAPVTAPPATGPVSQPAGHPAAPGSPVPGSATAPAQASTVPAATVPAHAAGGSIGGMPRWLLDLLLAAGVLAATAFVAEPAAVLARRRRAAGPPARGRAAGTPRDLARHAVEKARIIFADHERLIVTYCANDHAVYVLTPPGEDPRAVLRAARLVLPEETYEDLAGHLGVPSAWPMESME